MHTMNDGGSSRGPRAIVLGAGQDGGSPQFGGDGGVGPPRTASSVAVVSPLGSVVLLDASPDLRFQFDTLTTWSGYPEGRHRPVDAVAITHAHMGHYAGLVHFGKEAANTARVPLIATAAFLTFASSNAPWNALLENDNLTPVTLDRRVEVDASLSLVGIPVPHRAEYTDTVALSVIVDDEPVLLYLPDIDAWDGWPGAEATLEAHRVCVVDATFGTAKELAGRDIDEIPHPFVSDTITRFANLAGSTRMVLSHINHSNQVADPTSPLAVEARACGFEIAVDGLDLL